MGRILIAEPHGDVRALLEVVVERLGFQPVTKTRLDDMFLPVDAVIVEPAAPTALLIARGLRDRHPDVPIICVSIFPPEPTALELEPLAYLEKPFGLGELEGILRTALALEGAAA
jgi:DNA-binding response OmpR family regulator